MIVDFVRFEATDTVELQGWLSEVPGDTAVLHIHGKSGNGYQNKFLDNLRKMYVDLGVSFFSIDTRGSGIISDFRQGDGSKHAGSCFEIFDESSADIQGALDFLKSKGKTRFILQGHSLGCTKVVNYVLNNATEDILKIVLLAPTDMVGWARANNPEYLSIAEDLVHSNKPEELVNA